MAGRMGGRVLHDGVNLDGYIAEMSITPILLTALTVVPLAFFSVKLINVRLVGSLDFGNLATKYVNRFGEKWLVDFRTDERLLGTSDIQSLADLANSYQVVTSVRFLPVSLPVLLAHAVLLAVPFLPLALTKVPLDELIRRVAEKVL